MSPPSFLFDLGSPLKTRDFLSAVNIPQSRLLEAPASCALPSGGFSFFDQYLESTSPALGTQPLYDSAFPQLVCRPDLSSISSSTWRRQQQIPEWRRAEETPINDLSIGLPGKDSLRTSPSLHVKGRRERIHTRHDIFPPFDTCMISTNVVCLRSPSISCRSFIPPRLRLTMFSSRVSSNRLINMPQFFCSRNPKSPTWKNGTRSFARDFEMISHRWMFVVTYGQLSHDGIRIGSGIGPFNDA